MSVLLFAENAEGTFKKAIFEAATYAYDLAQSLGTDLAAVSVGKVADDELKKLGTYGVSKVYTVSDDKMDAFANTAYAAATAAVAKELGAKVVVFAQTYNVPYQLGFGLPPLRWCALVYFDRASNRSLNFGHNSHNPSNQPTNQTQMFATPASNFSPMQVSKPSVQVGAHYSATPSSQYTPNNGSAYTPNQTGFFQLPLSNLTRKFKIFVILCYLKSFSRAIESKFFFLVIPTAKKMPLAGHQIQRES